MRKSCTVPFRKFGLRLTKNIKKIEAAKHREIIQNTISH